MFLFRQVHVSRPRDDKRKRASHFSDDLLDKVLLQRQQGATSPNDSAHRREERRHRRARFCFETTCVISLIFLSISLTIKSILQI